MVPGTPDVLARLLAANTAASRDETWTAFVAAHSRLLLHVARSLGGDHDAAMDRYGQVLEHLRRDDCRRLRAFVADGRSEFSTWLVVVAQRICLDHHRRRYGRSETGEQPGTVAAADRAARRRLVDLVSAELDLDRVGDEALPDPADALATADAYHALEAALSLLAPADRLLVKLRFEDDLPVPEIARQLELPTRFHVYRRLTHVLAALRQALERVGIRSAIA
jgi:RNA polymerase sigma factor (sigma-70 family)